MRLRRWLALSAALTLAVGMGCRRREPPEATRARAAAAFLREQVSSLETLVARAEAGELTTRDQIAIGIQESVVKALLDASLPRDVVVAQRLRVRLESASPLFRGNKAFLLFRARVTSEDLPNASASIELGGGLEEFRFDQGRLIAQVALAHFSVLETSVGDLAADVLDRIVRNNLAAIERAIPPVEVPVQIEQEIKIGGLDDGPVQVKPGSLPLQIAVAQVIPVNSRLWILIDAKAGPWQRTAAAEK